MCYHTHLEVCLCLDRSKDSRAKSNKTLVIRQAISMKLSFSSEKLGESKRIRTSERGTVAHECSLSAPEAEAEGPRAGRQLGLHSNFIVVCDPNLSTQRGEGGDQRFKEASSRLDCLCTRTHTHFKKKIALWVNVLAAKSEDVSLISGTLRVERKNCLISTGIYTNYYYY